MKLPPIHTITYLEAATNYTIIHYEGGQTEIRCHTLKRYETELSLGAQFIRPHRKYLVNRSYVEAIKMAPENIMVLTNGKQIPIARRRR